MCLNIKKLTLSTPGDLDRRNEEIEIVVSNSADSMNLDCGLFLLDIQNTTSKNLNIKFPCSIDENVEIRFIERDICSDDFVTITVKCD